MIRVLTLAICLLMTPALAAAQNTSWKNLWDNLVKNNQNALSESPLDYVGGNPQGDVTVVEFFDYNCIYCRRALGAILQVLEHDKNVRVVLKEFPILGEDSVFAARAALAARKQNLYMPFHIALMSARTRLDSTQVFRIARTIGLDVLRLHEDMKDEEIEEALRQNHQIAETLGINGTPAFLVGSRLVPGAIDYTDLMGLIESARGLQ